MKALSLTQPWATLVAIGEKAIETRSWATAYRGPLLIHAASGFPNEARRFALASPCVDLLRLHGCLPIQSLPFGCLVAVADLVDVRQIPVQDTWPSRFDAAAQEHEAAFGDYRAGRYAWLLANVRPLPAPVPCRGALGLWTPPPVLAAAVAVRER